MFLYLIDKFGLLGIVYVGLASVAVGVLLFFITIFIGKKKKWALIVLAVVWYLLLFFCFVGEFAKHEIFGVYVYVSILYAFTVLSGILIFCGIFKHRVLIYLLCWLSFFIHGLPIVVAVRDFVIYDLAMSMNLEQAEEWALHRILTSSENSEQSEQQELADSFKKYSGNPIFVGLTELCLGRTREAALSFKKNQDDIFLEGVIKYCDGEYMDASMFFEKHDKEMSSLVNLLATTRDDEVKKAVKKFVLKRLSERYVVNTPSMYMNWNIRYPMFISIMWGQIIAIPMIVFRRKK